MAPPCRCKEVVGRPIAFASVGEKLADFEPFHPDRMAGRILGMGDVLTLIEKAEQSYDQDVAAKAAAKLQEGRFTLEDFLEQMQQIKKMGPLSGIVGMLPGIPKELKNANISDKELGQGRGDHPLDDAGGAARPLDSSTVRGGCASPTAAGPPPRRSTCSSSSSKRCSG